MMLSTTKKQLQLSKRISKTVYFIAFLTVLFAILKSIDVINIHWYWVFGPCWISVTAIIIGFIIYSLKY